MPELTGADMPGGSDIIERYIGRGGDSEQNFVGTKIGTRRKGNPKGGLREGEQGSRSRMWTAASKAQRVKDAETRTAGSTSDDRRTPVSDVGC